jgi:uncharacterized membrane protein YkvA (DUF1232 family)
MADKGLVAELYSEASFWDTLSKHATVAGPKLVENALVLYYTLKNPRTSLRNRLSIMGALAYFILPLDAIPDTLPGLGYLDDIGVIALERSISFSNNVDAEALCQALQTSRRWFGVV